MDSIIIGAGKYGEVYASFLRHQGINLIGFLDDDPTKQNKIIVGLPVLGKISDLHKIKADAVYCPIGDNNVRVKVLNQARKLGFRTPNFIHPDAKISNDVQIGENGVYILGNTFIMPYVKIEDDVMISIGSNILHHTTLCKGTFVSNGVNLGASLETKQFAYIGMGATIMTGVKTIGENSLVGAGAVVIRDVPDNVVVAGNPARIIKNK